MKKLVLLSFLLVSFLAVTFAQTENQGYGARGPITKQHDSPSYVPSENQRDIIFSDNFEGDNTTAGLTGRNYVWYNIDGGGASSTFNGSGATAFTAYEGLNYVGQNYQGANGLLIDQWLITPQFTVSAGDTLSFYWNSPTGQWDDSVYILISDGGSNIADFTLNLGRFRVPQGGWTRFVYNFAGAGTKRVAFRYYHTDADANSNFWGIDLLEIISGVVTGPGAATNPSPASAATGVALNPTLTWTNPAGATNVEVFFGTTAGNLSSVYNGATVTTYNAAAPAYNTTYYWRVNPSDAGGTTVGNVWSFTTLQDPNDSIIFNQGFEGATFPPTGWALESTVGTTQYWTRQTTASGYGTGTASARYAFYSSSSGNIQSLISQTFDALPSGTLTFDHAYAPYTDGANDQLQIETSNDGGTSWASLVLLNGGNSGELVTAPGQSGAFTPTPAQWATKSFALPSGTTRIKLKAISAYGNNLWVDNIAVINIIPVELTSFNANIDGNKVNLTWSTATETNNKGFSVERKSGESFETVAFVNGYGTTTASKNYSFTDEGLNSGTFTYRLKQVDFDGTFAYSKEVEVEINVPAQYSLNQNYPNPFNPATSIDFGLAVDSKVSLKVFNILGQEVAVLANGLISAGTHKVSFNGSNLFSGVYFVRMEAKGVDGSSFTSFKKMILNK
ncbi:MAG: choice-of-anchor J domain-containing protein [Ignavibacteria bacterium]|nr:choice-of-anchor J domain-containing protein [Ignavibacteria bacterium]